MEEEAGDGNSLSNMAKNLLRAAKSIVGSRSGAARSGVHTEVEEGKMGEGGGRRVGSIEKSGFIDWLAGTGSSYSDVRGLRDVDDADGVGRKKWDVVEKDCVSGDIRMAFAEVERRSSKTEKSNWGSSRLIWVLETASLLSDAGGRGLC